MHVATVGLLSLVMVACSTPAHKLIDLRAQELGFVRSTESGKVFRHVVYSPPQAESGNSIRVYIEGDGVAWRWRYFVSKDPTPRRALMLNLMAQDPGNTLYVGRPCYFGVASDSPCDSTYWTFSRFSEQVVDSMLKVIRQRTGGYKNIILIGHSGGGALALLLAEKLPKVAAVVTVAGNIDTMAWVQHHSYTPLYGSLNPAGRQPLPPSIKQLHLVGGKDQVIPEALIQDWAEKQTTAEVWRFAEYTHNCCWDEQWPKVLQWIATAERQLWWR